VVQEAHVPSIGPEDVLETADLEAIQKALNEIGG
jgi:hypothetical protein